MSWRCFGNPYDGQTLATIIPAMQSILGNKFDRVIADAGYRVAREVS